MKFKKNGIVVFDGNDIAAAFGMPSPYTKCATCKHQRSNHNRVIDRPERAKAEGMFSGRKDTYEECQHFWDRRRTKTNGRCPCEKFVEPES